MIPLSMTLSNLWPPFKVTTFLKSNIVNTKLLLHSRKLYLAYGMVLCLVTLTDLQTRRAGLSALAELPVNNDTEVEAVNACCVVDCSVVNNRTLGRSAVQRTTVSHCTISVYVFRHRQSTRVEGWVAKFDINDDLEGHLGVSMIFVSKVKGHVDSRCITKTFFGQNRYAAAYIYAVASTRSSAKLKTAEFCNNLTRISRVVHGLGWPAGWVGLGRVGNGSKICVFSGLGWVMGLKWQMCEKYMSSIDRQIRFVKTCCWWITASSV